MLRKNWLLYILGFLLLLLMIFKFQDNDLWMHLKTGQLILEQKTFPRTDSFTFSTANFEWIAHEWLSALIFYLVYLGGGIKALSVLGVIILAAIFAVYWFLVDYKQDDPFLILCWFIFAALLGRDTFFLRPHLFSFLFQAVFFTILYSYRKNQVSFLWWLIPLEICWANTHGATAFLGIAIPIIFVFGWFIENKLNPNSPIPINYKYFLIITVSLLAASLLNPYTYKIYQISFGSYSTGIFRRAIKEWAPPSAFGLESLIMLGVYLIFLSILIFRAIYKRRQGIIELFFFLLYGWLAIRSIRFVALLAVATIPAGIVLIREEEFLKQIFQKRFFKIILFVLLSLLSIYTILREEKFLFGLGLDERKLPIAAAKYLMKHKSELPRNIFNSFNLAGYLIWRTSPVYRVFIDGRQIGGIPTFLEYLSFYEAKNHWQKVLVKYDLEMVIADYVQRQEVLNIAAFRLEEALPAKEWALIYFDDLAMIFLKRKGKYANFISQSEFQLIKPYATDFKYLETLSLDKNLDFYLKKELDHAWQLIPASFKANYFKGLYFLKKGQYPEAVYHLQLAYKKEPRHWPNLNNLALAYLYNGEEEKAVQAFQKLLSSDSTDTIGWNNLGKLFLEKGKPAKAVKCFVRSIKIDNNLLESYYSLALAYEWAGEKDKARREWQIYIDLAKNKPQETEWIDVAQRHLAGLKSKS